MTRPEVSFTAVRSVILFVAGLAGIAHQTLVATQESPTLLILFAAMIGLPAFLNKDESHAAQTPPQLPEGEDTKT